MTTQAVSGWLQNAIKYCIKVRKMGAAGKESNNSATVNVESPNIARMSMPTYSTVTPDMTSSATSSRHFSKFENAALNGFVSNFRGAAFCIPPPTGGLLVQYQQYKSFALSANHRLVVMSESN